MATEDSQAKTGDGKNIVICCDGTGNKFIDTPDPDNSNSNVVKLYTTLGIHNDQVGYYHPGVGTAADPRRGTGSRDGGPRSRASRLRRDSKTTSSTHTGT